METVRFGYNYLSIANYNLKYFNANDFLNLILFDIIEHMNMIEGTYGANDQRPLTSNEGYKYQFPSYFEICRLNRVTQTTDELLADLFKQIPQHSRAKLGDALVRATKASLLPDNEYYRTTVQGSVKELPIVRAAMGLDTMSGRSSIQLPIPVITVPTVEMFRMLTEINNQGILGTLLEVPVTTFIDEIKRDYPDYRILNIKTDMVRIRPAITYSGQTESEEIASHEAIHGKDPFNLIRQGADRWINEFAAMIGQKSRNPNTTSIQTIPINTINFENYLKRFGYNNRLLQILSIPENTINTADITSAIQNFLDYLITQRKYPVSQICRMMLSCQNLDQVLGRLSVIFPEKYGDHQHLYNIEQMKKEMGL
jgi:hypothetical protein